MAAEEKSQTSFEDERLWKYMLVQDSYVITQFGNSVIGVGALFFAYGVLTSPLLRQLIALIGLGASTIMWMHTWGANKEFREVKEELKKTNPSLISRFDQLTSWRSQGKYRFVYYPIKRLMTFFMELMALAWLTIFLVDAGIPFYCLLHLDIIVLVITFIYGIVQRRRDIKEAKLRKLGGQQPLVSATATQTTAIDQDKNGKESPELESRRENNEGCDR